MMRMKMMWMRTTNDVDECFEMRECPQSIGPPRKLPGIIDDDDEEEKEEEEYDHDIDDDNDDDGDDHEF